MVGYQRDIIMTFLSAAAASITRPATSSRRRRPNIPFNWRLFVALTANVVAWLAIIGVVVALTT